MSNPLRGEIIWEYEGQSYTLCLPFKELIHLEEKLQKGIFEIAKLFAEGKAGLMEVTSVLWCGLRGGGESSMSFEDAGNLLTKAGFAQQLPLVMTLLSRTLSGAPYADT